ncbi:MAG: amino acid--tRNA ligase-related protein, partial [Clostridia bacterium]
MAITSLKDLKANFAQFQDKVVVVNGWVRTIRDSKNFAFIELNDGTSFKSTQVVFDTNLENFKDIIKQNVGAGLQIEGKVVLTPQMQQPFEIHASAISVEATSSPNYPLQKKRHSIEFLREIAHLRPRTNTFLAVFKVRSICAQAIHQFFAERNFVYVNTPLITASDCEGAGEMFKVTTLDLNNLPRDEKGAIDFTQDFFGKSSNLTVSGQLEAECFALAFKNVYTFGPTFRAENSNTTRHAAEFWMVEPEIAFSNLNDDMDLARDMIKFVIKT